MRKAGRLQLIQNSAPSFTLWGQCDIRILRADRLTAELSREAQCFSSYDEKLQFMLQEDKRIVASWGHNWAK